MKAVGIKVLKDNLSRYIKCVKEGDVVYVTDRDTVVAEIHRPTTAVPQRVDRWEAFLNEEERHGSIKRAGVVGGKPLRKLRATRRPMTKVNLQAVLDEVKSD